MPFARAPDGTRIAYRVRGSFPRTLIFIHAWGASGSYFDEAIDNLDLTSARAITVDLRGHGDSDKPDVELTWDLLARDVFAVADDARSRAFVVVGHSLGGKLSQYLPLVERRVSKRSCSLRARPPEGWTRPTSCGPGSSLPATVRRW